MDKERYTPETTMTMAQAKRMLEMAFNANGIREAYGYRTADEWLQKDGAEQVAMYIDNTEESIRFAERFLKETDWNVTSEDDLNAYLKGTLVGKERAKANAQAINLEKGTGYKDNRLYAPRFGTVTEETINTANQRVTNANRDKVYAARRDILFAAHSEEGLKSIGMTQSELNKKLRTWSNYSDNARQLSMRLNQNIAEEYRWTGLQNSSILSMMNVTDADIRSLVKDVKGASQQYQRNYIGNAMLSLDTHIDWSGIKFAFVNTGNVEASNTSHAIGVYSNDARTITIGTRGYLNTVAHEMGHALDYMWGRDIFGSESYSSLSESVTNESTIQDEDKRAFCKHFREFVTSLTDVGDIRSSYTMERDETFARFVARFVEWTSINAGSKYDYESKYYNDKFTQSQYVEFVKLLQEKARIDSKESGTKASIMDKDFRMEQKKPGSIVRTFKQNETTANVIGSSVELEGGSLLNRVFCCTGIVLTGKIFVAGASPL